MSRTGRIGAALLGVLVCLLCSTVIPGQAHAATTGSAVTVTSKFTDGKGASHSISLTVSQTQNLVGRQNISLSWQGAVPSHNYSFVDPADAQVEYPMVLMQCWGSDTAKAPLDPSHCETSYGLNNFNAGVYKDTNNPDNPNSTNTYVFGLTHLLKFQDSHGTWYTMVESNVSSGPNSNDIPLELLPGSMPLNARGEWSDTNGSRSNVAFEVRSATEYPASGCSSTQACTLVAVPITDPWCSSTASPTCSAGALTPVGPGSSGGTNAYVRAGAWWMESNWSHRLSVPLSFQPQNPCNVSDQRQAVPIDGSELASTEMSYSWDPDFCLDPTKFKLQYVNQSEPLARQVFTTNGPAGFSENAILTSQVVSGSPRPVVHAPVLATGFAVSFLIDDGKNNEITQLRMTPLLLAKLITQSYNAGSGEPALAGNPVGLFSDPEFLAVNPGFSAYNMAANPANLIMPYPTQMDTINALTSYINADPEARAWLNGTPDGYSGMVVNPAFRGYTLPQLATELRDAAPDPANRTHAPTSSNGLGAGVDYQCVRKMASPPQYFTLTSQGVQSLGAAATSLLNLQSPAQDVCDNINADSKYGQFTTQQQQTIGQRALIALTSVAQADQYLLPTAQLQVHNLGNGNRLWQGPAANSMAAALGYTTEDQATGVLSLDYPHLSPNSYPGTLPIYAAIPTSGLDKTTAGQYAQFLRFAATDGQTQGTGLGNLLPGYDPLPQVLRDYTLQCAQHVAAQDGQVPTPPSDLAQQIRNQTSGNGVGGGGAGGAGAGSAGAGGSAGGSGPSSGANAPGSGNRPVTLAATRGSDSWLADWGLPILLGLGLLAGVAVPLVRVAAQPGHPVRVWLGRFGGRLVTLARRS